MVKNWIILGDEALEPLREVLISLNLKRFLLEKSKRLIDRA